MLSHTYQQSIGQNQQNNSEKILGLSLISRKLPFSLKLAASSVQSFKHHCQDNNWNKNYFLNQGL
jgi:hypothetical protein